MCTRVLRMSLLASLVATPAFAVDALIHPLAEDFAAMPVRERTLVNVFMNAYPVISTPRLGDSSKDTFTMTDKYIVLNGEGVKQFAGSCVTVITNTNKIIRVEYPDFFVHTTQTIKMTPTGCGLDMDGEYSVPGMTIESGFSSQITKSTVPAATDLGELLATWDTWTISGKNVKYSATGVDVESGGVFSDSSTINLGATNALCIGSSSTNSMKGSNEQDMGEQGTQTVIYEFKSVMASACQTAKPIYGKAGADITSTVLDETTHYCIEDEASDTGKTCSDDVSLLGDGEEFPAEMIDGIPSFEAEA
jgi:hypothetical protein